MKTRKELKDEYKQMTPRMGIFAIKNNSNGKIYVARATNLDLIWNAEKFKLDAGGHFNRDLQNDWKETGGENFAFEILHELKNSDDPSVDARTDLIALEELALDDMQPFGERGYNKPKIRH